MGLARARSWADLSGGHVTIMIGVVAEHDSELAVAVLDDLIATVMTMRDMPLLVQAIADDCLVAPVERGNAHLEVRWISI